MCGDVTRHGEWLIIVRRHRLPNLVPVFRPPREYESLVEAVFSLNTPSSTRAYAHCQLEVLSSECDQLRDLLQD